MTTNFVFFSSFSNIKMLVFGFWLLSLVIALFLIVLLILIRISKKHKNTILSNLAYLQNVNLKERLTRIYQLTKKHHNYEIIHNIWLTRYQKLLKHDFFSIIKSYELILQKDRTIILSQKKRKLIKNTYKRSNKLKLTLKTLLTEIDNFLSFEQLLREYQLMLQQKFNFLQAELIKINFHIELNYEQINAILAILETKLQNLEAAIIAADFSIITQILAEITEGITVLATILMRLPYIAHQVNHVILEKMQNLKKQVTDTTFSAQLGQLEQEVNHNLVTARKLLTNLQYKKAQAIVTNTLHLIYEFTNNWQKERKQELLFWQNYQKFLTLGLNFDKTWTKLQELWQTLIPPAIQNANNDKIMILTEMIKTELATSASLTAQLNLANTKPLTYSYEVLLTLLKALFTSASSAFASLYEYNQILLQALKPQIIVTLQQNKINSMMLQIENLLANEAYFYLNDEYQQQFQQLQIKMQQLVAGEQNHNELLTAIQNQVFYLYQGIKLTISFYKLANAAIVYANRFDQSYENINPTLRMVNNYLEQQCYQQALTTLINWLQKKLS